MADERRRDFIDDNIRELRHRSPFSPFNVVMASGDKYLIEDPEMMVVSSTEIIYVVPRSEQVMRLRKSQIVALEEFASKPAA